MNTPFKKFLFCGILFFVFHFSHRVHGSGDNTSDFTPQERNALKQIMEFRKLEKLDQILTEDMSDMRKWCNFQVKGHDIENCPILYWPFGTCDLRRIILAGKQDRLRRYLQYLIETVGVTVRSSKTKTGKQVVQAIGILDLNGFSLRHQACLGCLPFYTFLIETLDTNYPQALKSFNIINTPKAFHDVLSRFILVAAPSTKEIVHAYGYDKEEWKRELLKTIRSDQLQQILSMKNGNRETTMLG